MHEPIAFVGSLHPEERELNSVLPGLDSGQDIRAANSQKKALPAPILTLLAGSEAGSRPYPFRQRRPSGQSLTFDTHLRAGVDPGRVKRRSPPTIGQFTVVAGGSGIAKTSDPLS